jgi:hypothetical protein
MQRGLAWANATTAWEEFPRPLRVICWDWTKAIALPRVRLARRKSKQSDPVGTYKKVWGAMP